jgi:crossover junction endodeoxyribonuclease RusA
VNSYWRHPNKGPLAGRSLISQEGRQYRESVAKHIALLRSPSVGHMRVRVDIEARMPDRRKRDLDNLPKALFDALTHAGIWHDDEQVDEYRVWRSPIYDGRVIVRIQEWAHDTQQEVEA